MKVREIMSIDPKCCSPETSLREVAEFMLACDCGEIPVCDARGRPIGVVTDRDIVCRIVATGTNPARCTAADCMSRPVITVDPDTDIEDAAILMEQHQLRRLPVIDADGACCGMLSQADLAIRGLREQIADVIERVSEPSGVALAAH